MIYVNAKSGETDGEIIIAKKLVTVVKGQE